MARNRVTTTRQRTNAPTPDPMARNRVTTTRQRTNTPSRPLSMP